MQLVLKAAVIALFTRKSRVTTVIGTTGAVGKQLRLKRNTEEKLKNLPGFNELDTTEIEYSSDHIIESG